MKINSIDNINATAEIARRGVDFGWQAGLVTGGSLLGMSFWHSSPLHKAIYKMCVGMHCHAFLPFIFSRLSDIRCTNRP